MSRLPSAPATAALGSRGEIAAATSKLASANGKLRAVLATLELVVDEGLAHDADADLEGAIGLVEEAMADLEGSDGLLAQGTREAAEVIEDLAADLAAAGAL